MSHEDFAFEACLLKEVRHACAVVHMKVCQQQDVDLLGLNHVEVGQALDA